MPESEPPSADACVFCSRVGQPMILFETSSLYVMPDKFPMAPGHTLIISKAHLSCYGVAPPGVLRQLDQTATRMRRFLAETYGRPVLTFENGVAGQSVFHAHLHLIPVSITGLPVKVAGHPDVTHVSGWDAVRKHVTQSGHYRYLEIGGDRWVIKGYSPILQAIRSMMAEATGLRWGPEGWIKTTSLDDVREVNRRWEMQAGGSLGT